MSGPFSRQLGIVLLFFTIGFSPEIRAQAIDGAPVGVTNSPADQIATLQLQLTNAWQRVLTIVNQPIRAYRMQSNIRYSEFSPGWFHPGANVPDFDHVDIRTTQKLIYKGWVTSDINPGIMFPGDDLEFNPNTKLFYTNRSLPKKRLTEAEMLEINSLYRVIGHCRDEIARLEAPADGGAEAATDDNGTNDVAANQSLAFIRKIPRQTRMLYGGIGVGVLLVLMVGIRMMRGTRAE